MHIGSYVKMQSFVNNHLTQLSNSKLKILDVGSQDVNGSYKPLFENRNWQYIGCDMIAGNNVDVILKDIYNWSEFDSDSFDVIVSGQVFEHVEFFWITIMEIVRVLKEGGLCCIIAPSAGFEHRYPVDCWRYYPDGLKALGKYAGVEVLEAYTQWENVNYSDGSGFWKDSVFIFRKPKMNQYQKTIMMYKNSLSKLIAQDISNSDILAVGDVQKPLSPNNELLKLVEDILSETGTEKLETLNKFDTKSVLDVITANFNQPVEVLNFVANANYNSAFYEKVLPYLTAAFDLNNKDENTLYNLGYFLHSLGENELALRYLNCMEHKDEEIISLIKSIK